MEVPPPVSKSYETTPHINPALTALATNSFAFETIDFVNHMIEQTNSFIADSTLSLDRIGLHITAFAD